MNQAIGRVIRHKDDYGVILLCDRRFGDAQFKTELSSWVRPYMKVYGKQQFGSAVRNVRDFFLGIKQKVNNFFILFCRYSIDGMMRVNYSYMIF